MLDIGWQELFFIVVVALIVVGPKDLPRALATISRGVRKIRGLAREFQDGINDVVREAELDELKKKMEGAGKDVGQKVKNMVDDDGTLTEDFDPVAFNRRVMANLERTPPRSPRSATNPPDRDNESPDAPPPPPSASAQVKTVETQPTALASRPPEGDAEARRPVRRRPARKSVKTAAAAAPSATVKPRKPSRAAAKGNPSPAKPRRPRRSPAADGPVRNAPAPNGPAPNGPAKKPREPRS